MTSLLHDYLSTGSYTLFECERPVPDKTNRKVVTYETRMSER